MKIFMTGATGFVGAALCEYFLSRNHTVVGVGRRNTHPLQGQSSFQYIHADTSLSGIWQEQIPKADVVINLAGESILRRWNDRQRERVWESRVETTHNVTAAMGPGQTLISFSATGFFGNGGSLVLDESTSQGSGFLADLCAAWEGAAMQVEGARVVICRLGVVLGNGGALEKMLPIFKLGMGGRLGGGHQWFPWIHLNDVVGSIQFLLSHAEMEGVVNLVSPRPVTNRAFTEALGTALGVPTLAPVPKMMLSMLFGEASCVLLDSQRVVPKKLLDAGYAFEFSTVQSALNQILTE